MNVSRMLYTSDISRLWFMHGFMVKLLNNHISGMDGFDVFETIAEMN